MLKGKYKYVLLVICLLVIGFGVSYAFFDYYRLGNSHQVIAGEVSMKFNEGTDTISLSNVFPETKEEARSRDDNFITFTISGINTTTNKDVYYEIMLNEGEEESGKTRFTSKDLVFDLVEVNNDGTETYLVDAMNYNDFNERRIWVETIDHNTTTQLNKTYKLRMWLDGKVIISDTESYADYTTSVFKNSYASVKVSAYGDFVEKNLPYNYMTRIGVVDAATSTVAYWSNEIEAVKTNITNVNFVAMKHDVMQSRFEAATIKKDMTDTSKSEVGTVLVWLENNADDNTKYTMYVASDGITFFPSDSSGILGGFTSLTEVNFENVNTREVTNMMMMFGLSTALSKVNVSKFDVSNVVNMQSMFFNCRSLNSLEVGNWDTSKVTNMRTMFQNCSNITSLNVSNWDTSMVTNMAGMFNKCLNLTSLDVSNWDTSQVTTIRTMFQDCGKLISLDVYYWDTSNVTDMAYIFNKCSNLTNLNVSNWDTSQVTLMTAMFNNCANLITLEVSGWDTSMVTDMYIMFGNCSNLTSLDVSNWDTSQVTDMEFMFYYCSNLETIYNDSDWSNGKVTADTSESMFDGCTNLVGGATYDSTKVDITMANPTTGYFTKKSA